GVTVIDGSTARVTWTTSKAASSQIDYYSTDPTFVGPPITKADAAFVTQHSFTLTGLISISTYYFTITAVDQSGEIQLAMAPSFTVPGPTLHDTASVDFLGGTQ